MALTANTVASSATTALTTYQSFVTSKNRYYGTSSGAGHITIYTAPADRLAYIYPENIVFYDNTTSDYAFYGHTTTTTLSPFRFFSKSSTAQVYARRINGQLIAPNAASFVYEYQGFGTSAFYLIPAYTNDYHNALSSTSDYSQIYKDYWLLNPGNTLYYYAPSTGTSIWDFIIEEHIITTT